MREGGSERELGAAEAASEGRGGDEKGEAGWLLLPWKGTS